MEKGCSGEQIPLVRLALEKQRCIRGTSSKARTPKEIVALIGKHYSCRPQEFMLTVCMNSAQEVVAIHEVAMGALDQTSVDPRIVFGGAMIAGAVAMVPIHNHPSGNAEPSNTDIELTRTLMLGAKYLGIRILDHLVIARGGGYTSFAERGLMPAVT